jgi:catechol 2,3-dioxygenase-like lactoylglutathione lyase family enzyme
MNFNYYGTVLFVKDIEISKAFYCDTLGLLIDLDFGKNVIFRNGFTIWEIQPAHIIPATLGREKVADSSVNRFELYFETEDISLAYKTLLNKNINFLHMIHEEPWGQQTIRFFDPDNHLIEIGESMGHFILRFFKQGLSAEQISEKTHVPLAEVKRLIKS